MPYTLYVDKPENFECEVSVKNASLKNAFARMIVESGDLILMFKGQLKDGKCSVPIRRLKGLLDENTTGKMHLEVIVEDTYFKPWEDEFKTEQHTDVKVKVEEQKPSSNKPIVEVKVDSPDKKVINKQKGINILVPMYEISEICKKVGITRSNLEKRKSDFQQLLKEYFDFNPEFKTHKYVILNGLKRFIK